MQRLAFFILFGVIAASLGMALSGVFSSSPKQAGALPGHHFPVRGKPELTLPAADYESSGGAVDPATLISQARFVPAETAGLDPRERVFGLALPGFTAAFPERIMAWHQVANVIAAGEKLSVTYCPLSGAAACYKNLTLADAGLIKDSGMVLFDRETRSLFRQLTGDGLQGELAGTTLAAAPLAATTWGRWRKAHPHSLLLAPQPGAAWAYATDPFELYGEQPQIWHKLSRHPARLKPKTRVFVVRAGTETAAIERGRLAAGKAPLKLDLGGREVELAWDHALDAPRARGADHSFEAYWFAVNALGDYVRLVR